MQILVSAVYESLRVWGRQEGVSASCRSVDREINIVRLRTIAVKRSCLVGDAKHKLAVLDSFFFSARYKFEVVAKPLDDIALSQLG